MKPRRVSLGSNCRDCDEGRVEIVITCSCEDAGGERMKKETLEEYLAGLDYWCAHADAAEAAARAFEEVAEMMDRDCCYHLDVAESRRLLADSDLSASEHRVAAEVLLNRAKVCRERAEELRGAK